MLGEGLVVLRSWLRVKTHSNSWSSIWISGVGCWGIVVVGVELLAGGVSSIMSVVFNHCVGADGV